MLEAGQFADLGDQADGERELQTAQGLDGLDHGIESPRRCRFTQGALKPLAAGDGSIDRTPVFFEGDLRPRLREAELGQPAAMGGPPLGGAGIAYVMHQQERLEGKRPLVSSTAVAPEVM